MRVVLARAGLSFISLALLTASCRAARQDTVRLEPLPHWTLPSKPTDEPVKGELVPGPAVIAATPYNSALQDHPGRRVVRDSIAWREVWEQAHSSWEIPPLPAIDFRKEMVLAATTGPFGFDDRFSIDSILQVDHQILAVVTREVGCGPTGSVAASGPTVLVRVPARRSVKFVERRRPLPRCA